MSYLPAEVFKDPATGMMVLEVIDAITHIVPRQDPGSIIAPSNRARLSDFNRRSLNRSLREDNLEGEVKKLIKSRELFTEIAKAKVEYGKFSENRNLIMNRFANSKDKVIRGVGVDGGGMIPTNYTQERHAYAAIEEGADKFDSWPAYTGEEEEILRASCGNVVFWHAASMAQFPIGTPVEIASAVIELTAPKMVGKNEYYTKITGDELVKRRVECNYLKYYLDGNKLDLDDRSFNGKQFFNESNFRAFFRSGKAVVIIADSKRKSSSSTRSLSSTAVSPPPSPPDTRVAT